MRVTLSILEDILSGEKMEKFGLVILAEELVLQDMSVIGMTQQDILKKYNYFWKQDVELFNNLLEPKKNKIFINSNTFIINYF